MTEHSFTMPNLADMTVDMAEANRLTQAGRLAEASALIQRSLSGTPAGHRARETADPSAGAAPDAAGLHAARLTDGLRDGLRNALGQAWRSLRTSPVAKGLKDIGLFEAPHGKGPQGKTPSGKAPGEGQGDRQFVERSFSNASGSRDYKLFIPSRRSINGSGEHTGKRPLVVMLHGCKQSPDDIAAGTRLNRLAEEEGFYVAYPRQTGSANLQKCWNWFEPQNQGRENGEAGIIAGIARAVSAEHDVDPSRIYIAGMSAGGAAASNVARAYPDLFAAVGVHSGLAAGCARDLSSALMAMRNGAPGGSDGPGTGFGAGPAADAVRVPTIVFHGDLDTTVNAANGEAILAQAGIEGLTAERESGAGSGHAYARTRYRDGDGRVQIESWLVKGAGHAWMGGSPEGSYTDPQGPDASRAMLDFFKEHALGRSLRR